jgi:hypothetical protein
MAQNGHISRKERKIRGFRLIRGICVERFLLLEKTMVKIVRSLFICA